MKKSKYTFLYQAHDGSIMRPESFLNINKGRTLSSSQLRVLGITKIKTHKPQAQGTRRKFFYAWIIINNKDKAQATR
jgi:hypothetical protein